MAQIAHYRHYHIIFYLIILVIFISSLCCYAYYQYNGPILNSHARIGYYGHHHLKVLNPHGLREQFAAKKIYITKQKIDWNRPIEIHDYTYYFPKNMPKRTRDIFIKRYK